jgi:two-component system response regulator FlrC
MAQATVLVVEDDVSMREALSDTLQLAGYKVSSAGDGVQALEILDDEEVAMVISDVQMERMDGHTLLQNIKKKDPRLPVLIMTAYGTIPKAVEAMREGAIDYMVKPFEAEVVINTVNRYAGNEQNEAIDFIAVDELTCGVIKLAARAAKSDATIMITGESGSGKEVIARFMHNNSDRASQPFVAINCAAIPENMLESIMFGYEKGAFTGAYKSCPGKFELAQGGTILLDEITEMDMSLQAKLLRVLQEREVERLGGNKLIELDVRILATTNRNLAEDVASGKFREDLFYRLNVFPINMPPLRDRKKDILPIASRFIEQIAIANNKIIPKLSMEASEMLMCHTWPGNVRELENVIQRAMILQAGAKILPDDIVFEMSANIQPNGNNIKNTEGTRSETLGDGVKQHEYALIMDTLNSFNGSRKKTADALGVSPRTLRYKLAKMREEGYLALEEAD